MDPNNHLPPAHPTHGLASHLRRSHKTSAPLKVQMTCSEVGDKVVLVPVCKDSAKPGKHDVSSCFACWVGARHQVNS